MVQELHFDYDCVLNATANNILAKIFKNKKICFIRQLLDTYIVTLICINYTSQLRELDFQRWMFHGR